MEPRVAIESGAELEIAALHLRERRFGPEQPIDDATLACEVLAEPESQVRGFRFELTETPGPAGLFVEILGYDRTPPLEDSPPAISPGVPEPRSPSPDAATATPRERRHGRECGGTPPD